MTGKVLLLGMVYSNQTKPMRGQEYRDRVRCEALKSLGYEVYTLDDKHNSDNLPNHVMANFNNHRVMMKSIKAKWGDIQFDAIMLDYFFSPNSWARDRWSDKFFRETLPLLATTGLCGPRAKIWLPTIETVEETIIEFQRDISPYFNFGYISNPDDNPLYFASGKATSLLKMCPDNISNETQEQYLYAYSNSPFCFLERHKIVPQEICNFSIAETSDLQEIKVGRKASRRTPPSTPSRKLKTNSRKKSVSKTKSIAKSSSIVRKLI